MGLHFISGRSRGNCRCGDKFGPSVEVWTRGVAGEGVDVLGVEDFSHLDLRLLAKLSNWCKSYSCKMCGGWVQKKALWLVAVYPLV